MKDQAMDNASNLKTTLAQIDLAIERFKDAEKQGEMLKRLKNNPDFIYLFIDGYIEAEAKKLFEILIDPSGASPYSEDTIRRKLDAVSNLKGYMNDIEIAAESAPLDIAREEDFRVKHTAEYAESGE